MENLKFRCEGGFAGKICHPSRSAYAIDRVVSARGSLLYRAGARLHCPPVDIYFYIYNIIAGRTYLPARVPSASGLARVFFFGRALILPFLILNRPPRENRSSRSDCNDFSM